MLEEDEDDDPLDSGEAGRQRAECRRHAEQGAVGEDGHEAEYLKRRLSGEVGGGGGAGSERGQIIQSQVHDMSGHSQRHSSGGLAVTNL